MAPESPTALRRRNRGVTRAAILDTAERLLLQRGVAETSLSDLAREAKVAKGLILHYFGTKDALWSEVKQRRFQQYVAEQLADLAPSTDAPDDVLREAIARYFRFLSANPDTVRLFVRMWLEGDTSLAELDRQVTHAGVDALLRAQGEGRLRTDVDPLHMLAVFVCASLGWFTFRHLSPATPERDEAFLADLTRVFFTGVLPSAGAGVPPSEC